MTEDTTDFSTDWRFHPGDAEGAEQIDFDDAGWTEVVLPHSWNAEDTFTPGRGYYRGAGWYRKRFDLPAESAGKKAFVEFGAGFAVADVWINAQFAGHFMGGFTGFQVDATPFVGQGENLVAVKLDNSHDPDVLPGKEVPDYNLYGGLYREATLVIKDRLYIPQHGVTITTPSVWSYVATVCVEVAVQNEDDDAKECACAVSVNAPNGNTVAEARETRQIEAQSGAVFTLELPEIPDPALWSPDSPNIHTAHVAVTHGTSVKDSIAVRFGIRWFRFAEQKGFALNGRRLQLRGVNRHQDYPGLGNAVPRRLQVRDAELIKEMGANFVRTSHYPQHPAFLDACDRLGILVYEEIASWQHIGGERFFDNAEAMLREMIARDKNHPSIILWGLLNEGRSRELFDRLNAAAHEADPTRPTIYAENRPEEGKELGTVFVPDVLGINYKVPHLDEIRAALPGLNLLSSEHTNADHAQRGELDAEISQAEKLKADLDAIEARSFMAGSALWSMHDYGTDYEPVWPIQHSGILDAHRLPKEGYHYLRIRWSAKPTVHICGHWTWPGHEGATRTVTVLTNCDIVELFHNGRSLGPRMGRGMTQWDVPYEPGDLQAVGHKDELIVSHTVRTARAPAELKLEALPDKLVADGSDAAQLTVRVVDIEGVTVPQAGEEVAFDVEGPGVLRGIGGQPRVALIAGVGRTIVQATTIPGLIMVRALYPGLDIASIKLAAS